MKGTDASPVKIRKWGTIVIEDSILCDGGNCYGMDDGKTIGCYTHIHNDHICGLENTLGTINSHAYATSITRDLSSALLMHDAEWIRDRTNYHGLEFDKVVHTNGFDISFKKANHILGSGQLLVQSNRNRILYTSDFMLEGTDTASDIDYLILDATHGISRQRQRFDDKETCRNLIVNEVRNILEGGAKEMNVYASRGTLQLIMSWLYNNVNDDVCFLAPRKERNIARVYTKYGYNCGNVINDEEIEQFRISDTQRIRFLPHASAATADGDVPAIRIGASSATSLNNPTRVINLQEHATVDEVCTYVGRSNPKNVIVDNSSRTSNPDNARCLAESLSAQGFSVILSPETRHE